MKSKQKSWTDAQEYRKKRKQEVKSLIAYLKGNVTLDEALRNLGYKKECKNDRI